MIFNNLHQENKKILAIIIGSGPAGISIALELEKKKINSLIIESGDIENNTDSEKFLKSESIGDHESDYVSNRMRMFGGTSSIWGGNCNPMSKSDFYEWPIDKSELDKFSLKANEFLNLKKKFQSQKFSKNLNIYNLVWSNLRINSDYFNHIKISNYISLSLNTSFLNFNFIDKKINSIDCVSKNKKYTLNSNLYILACGGIENSRLLLWSKLKNDKLFNSESPIGEYYMHHPYHKVANGIINYTKLKNYYFKNNHKHLPLITCDSTIYLEANEDFMSSNDIINSGMYVNFEELDIKNDLFKQLIFVAPEFIKNIYDDIKTKQTYEISIKLFKNRTIKI